MKKINIGIMLIMVVSLSTVQTLMALESKNTNNINSIKLSQKWTLFKRNWSVRTCQNSQSDNVKTKKSLENSSCIEAMSESLDEEVLDYRFQQQLASFKVKYPHSNAVDFILVTMKKNNDKSILHYLDHNLNTIMKMVNN